MLTAILADDEEIVRSSMEKWIPWNELGVSLVGVASDGEEAYGMILSLHPDIVITDIRMPRLDGLELIKKVSEEKLVVSFIIISGFGEFEYAQKAMSYGVKHYLLKPVLKEKLRETILSVRTEIEEKQKEAVGNNLDNKYGFYLQRGMLMEVLSDEALVESIVERSHKIIPFDVNEVLSMLVTEALETDMDYLKRNKNVEVRDTVYCYFLHVEQFLPKGDPLPLEYAKNEIKEMIINLKRVAFINQIKNDLYREASENNDIIYYKPDNE